MKKTLIKQIATWFLAGIVGFGMMAGISGAAAAGSQATVRLSEAKEMRLIASQTGEVSPEDVPYTGDGLDKPSDDFEGVSHEDSLLVMIVGWTNWVLGFVGAVAIAVIIYAGYLYILGEVGGGGVDKAKKILTGAIIGLILIISAYAIVNTVIKAI